MLLLHFSSPVDHLLVGHLIRNAFIINATKMCFLSTDNQMYPSWAYYHTPRIYFRRFCFLFSPRAVWTAFQNLSHTIPGMVHSQTAETTALFRHISTAVSYTQSLQIRRKILCKMHTRNTKQNLLFLKQIFSFSSLKILNF